MLTCGPVDMPICGLYMLWTFGSADIVGMWTFGSVDRRACGPLEVWSCGPEQIWMIGPL